MSRTRVSAALMLVATGVGAAAWWRWPTSAPALDCPREQVRLDERGVARCGPGRVLPAGQAHSVGQRSDLNLATASEFALLPGISEGLALELVAERQRLGGFTEWEQVDAVDGVGPGRLGLLQREFSLHFGDAGVW